MKFWGTVLVTSYLRDSNEFRSILLKLSMIACKSKCRLAVPFRVRPAWTSQKALNSHERQILHTHMYIK